MPIYTGQAFSRQKHNKPATTDKLVILSQLEGALKATNATLVTDIITNQKEIVDKFDANERKRLRDVWAKTEPSWAGKIYPCQGELSQDIFWILVGCSIATTVTAVTNAIGVGIASTFMDDINLAKAFTPTILVATGSVATWSWFKVQGLAADDYKDRCSIDDAIDEKLK
ncbi:MAG: hypothetical protein WC707_00130 [Candidatus Babeliaceae bacterium]|jgi:hypothetical protein